MNNPHWEMQAMYGDSINPWELTVSTSFWQSPMGGPLSSNNNPAFYAIAPETAFDSWFAIGKDDKESSIQALDGPLRPLKQFEQGKGFLENSLVGTSVIGVWIAPNVQGRPDKHDKILIAQITSDGDVSTTMNFQFRELDKKGHVLKPTHVEKSIAVAFSIAGNGPSVQYSSLQRP